jgi:isoleucyl-tRNA synthetase
MSSLLCGIGMHNRAPFKEVATYGWTLDEQGRALSKSLGNFIDPVQVMDQLGGDIVRLWVASVDFREDVVASLPLLKRLAEEIYRKLRNTFRFLLGSLRELDPATGEPHDFDPRSMEEGGDAVPFEQMQPIDQYILARAAELTAKITKAYDEMEFHRVYHLLNEFCNSELSAFYLDVLKDRLYTYPVKFKPGNDYQRDLYIARRSAQTAIYKITDALARLTAPILSFTADEVWQNIPGKEGSVHLTLFPKPEDLALGDITTILDDWKQLLEYREIVLKELESARQAKLIGKSLDARVVTGGHGPVTLLRKYGEATLAEIFNVSKVEIGMPGTVSGALNLGTQPVAIVLKYAEAVKCERCWRYTDDVGQNTSYPSVCLRCAEALDAIDFPPYPASSNK